MVMAHGIDPLYSLADPSSHEVLWRKLRQDFEELRDLIETARIESREEAIDRTYPEWFDPELGVTVRSWLLIPHRKSNDAGLVKRQFEFARSLIPELERLFERQELTVGFLRDWGAFCSAASFIEAIYLSDGDDLGPERAGQAGAKAVSKDTQRRWVAHLLHQLLSEKMTRTIAEERIATHIRTLVAADNFPAGFDRKWFEAILDKTKYDLNTRYSEKHLYPKIIKRLIRKPIDDCPPYRTSIHTPRV